MHGSWDFNFTSRIEPDFTASFSRDNVRGVIIQIRKTDQAEKLFSSPSSRRQRLQRDRPAAIRSQLCFPTTSPRARWPRDYFLERGFRNFAFFGHTIPAVFTRACRGIRSGLPASRLSMHELFSPCPDGEYAAATPMLKIASTALSSAAKATGRLLFQRWLRPLGHPRRRQTRSPGARPDRRPGRGQRRDQLRTGRRAAFQHSP